jgi:hypothetical protein
MWKYIVSHGKFCMIQVHSIFRMFGDDLMGQNIKIIISICWRKRRFLFNPPAKRKKYMYDAMNMSSILKNHDIECSFCAYHPLLDCPKLMKSGCIFCVFGSIESKSFLKFVRSIILLVCPRRVIGEAFDSVKQFSLIVTCWKFSRFSNKKLK